MVYFSWSGVTARVAEEIARALSADREEIKCYEYKNLLAAVLQMMFARNKELRLFPLQYQPENYDLVVVGSPTWAGRPPPPVMVYLRRYAAGFKRVAFFSTSASPAEQNVLAEMARVSGKEPVAVAHFHRSVVRLRDFVRQVQEFIARVSGSPGSAA